MKLLHLPHVEDLIFSGHFLQACDTLYALIDGLTGEIPQRLTVSTKYDGAPAIVFGTHPVSGQFFVGTKSVFNKRSPKLIYEHRDARAQYGNNELGEKMEVIFEALHSSFHNAMMPKGVYQGDLMFLNDDVEFNDKLVSFTPNTITYHLNRQHPFSEDIKRASIGMVVHTRYEGETLQEMRAYPDVNQNKFWSDDSVFFIDPSMNLKHYMITELQYDVAKNLLEQSESHMKGLGTDFVSRHGKMLNMFINYCVRIGEASPGLGMYRTFLLNRGEITLADDVDDHKEIVNTLFVVHRFLTQAKKIIMGALNMGCVFYHEVNGVPTTGEGFVVTYHGVPVKLVDRLEFSRLNFINNKFERVQNA